MIAADIAHLIRERVCSEIQVSKINDNRVSIAMPLTFSDGDSCRLLVSQEADGSYTASDGGHVVASAAIEGVSLLSRGHVDRLRQVAGFYGAKESNGELVIAAEPNELGDAIFALVQTCLETARLSTLAPERAKRTERFNTIFQRVVERSVPESALKKNWHDLKFDPEAAFRVDYHVQTGSRHVLVYGASSLEKTWKSISSALHYRRWKKPIQTVFAYSDRAAASRPANAAMKDCADVSFSVDSQRRELRHFLRGLPR